MRFKEPGNRREMCRLFATTDEHLEDNVGALYENLMPDPDVMRYVRAPKALFRATDEPD